MELPRQDAAAMVLGDPTTVTAVPAVQGPEDGERDPGAGGFPGRG